MRINYTSLRDGTISWGTSAIPLAITYSPAPLTISAQFSLMSDPLDDQVVTFPNQPALGLSISYAFGNPRAGMVMPGKPFERRLGPSRRPASEVEGDVIYEGGGDLDDR